MAAPAALQRNDRQRTSIHLAAQQAARLVNGKARLRRKAVADGLRFNGRGERRTAAQRQGDANRQPRPRTARPWRLHPGCATWRSPGFPNVHRQALTPMAPPRRRPDCGAKPWRTPNRQPRPGTARPWRLHPGCATRRSPRISERSSASTHRNGAAKEAARLRRKAVANAEPPTTPRNGAALAPSPRMRNPALPPNFRTFIGKHSPQWRRQGGGP